MKRKIHLLLPMVLVAVIFAACEETSEQSKYHDWKERNEIFMDSLQRVYDAETDPELRTLKDSQNGETIFYKILKEGDTKQDRPFFTSTVGVYYRAMLIDEAVFNAAPNEKYYTRLYENLAVFESNFNGDDPDPEIDAVTTKLVTGFNTGTGWMEALQWMYPGARWELYVPYQSTYNNGTGYGGNMPSYSTHIFDITLVDIQP